MFTCSNCAEGEVNVESSSDHMVWEELDETHTETHCRLCSSLLSSSDLPPQPLSVRFFHFVIFLWGFCGKTVMGRTVASKRMNEYTHQIILIWRFRPHRDPWSESMLEESCAAALLGLLNPEMRASNSEFCLFSKCGYISRETDCCVFNINVQKIFDLQFCIFTSLHLAVPFVYLFIL